MDIKRTNLLHAILFSIIAILPLLVRAVPYEFISPALEPGVIKMGLYIDAFNQIKFQWLLALSVLLIFVFSLYLYFNQIELNYFDILSALFIVLTLVSTWFSQYKYISLWGKYNRTDGAVFFILLFSLLFIASKLIYSDKLIDLFSFALWPFLIFNSLLAWIYQNKINFLENPLFKKLVYPSADYEVTGYIMATFENPNYLSGFAGFLSIYFLTRFISTKKGNILDAFAFILSLFCLLASFSSSGIVAFIFTTALIPLFFGQGKLISFAKMTLTLPFTWIFIKYFIGKDVRIQREFTILSRIFQKHFISLLLVFLLVFLVLFYLKKFIQYNKWKKFISIGTLVLVFISFLLFPYSPYYQKDYPHHLYELDEIISFVENKQVKTDDLSGRIFVWRETIDLIKDRPLVGYGFGTLAYELNQFSIFDPGSKWPSNSIFDKPHNTYLEIAYGGGLFALAAFMLIFVNLFFQGLEKLRDDFNPQELAIFLGMIAFLIQALINDSNVGSYPVMFIFFGILISRFNNPVVEMEEKNHGKKRTRHK